MPAIALIYLPGKFKEVIFAYLANIYALLISASYSISNSNLTQNDGVSVLVAVLSPATLYLWADIFFTLLFRQRLPSWSDYQTIKESHRHILQYMIIGSFIFWVILVGIIMGSPRGVSFSQPACRKGHEAVYWKAILWPLPYLMQLLVLITGLNLPVPLGVAQDRRVLLCVISCISVIYTQFSIM